MIQINGSYGEGGGQILRNTVALAAALNKPVEIYNIRAKRSKPGLQAQHLTAVKAAAAICDAQLTGAALGSQHVVFEPAHPVQSGEFHFDIGTAGATTLVSQTVLLPLALAQGKSVVHLTGGTHMPMAPPAEYLEAVFLPAMQRAGVSAKVEYNIAGYYPRGGGSLRLEVEGVGTALEAFDLTERGKLNSLRAYIATSELPDHVAKRGSDVVHKQMKVVGRSVHVEIRERPSPGPGAAVILAAECDGGFAGFTGLGARGKPMEKVTEEPCRDFMKWWKGGASVDEHLADQLVLAACLARGESRW